MLLSVVWCISRCICCGLSCCCECCYCLKCCGNCCGCCDPPRGRKHKYLDEPFVPPHHQAYKAQEPMVAGPPAPSPFSLPQSFPPPRSEHAPVSPQYAEFDVSKKNTAAAGGHEDALPVMPTWESAGSKKVLVEEEEVEMDQLKKPEASHATAGQNVPLMTGASTVPGPVSPIPSPDHRSPYSPPGAPGANGGYMGASATDPYTASGRGYNNFNGPGAYGQSQMSLGADQGYGMPSAAIAGAGRRSPMDYNNNNNNNNGYGQVPHNQDGYGQDQGYPPSRPAVAGYNSYNSGRQGSYDDYNQSQASSQPYGRGPGMRSPPQNGSLQAAGTYPQERMGRTPPPRAAEYGGARTYSPAPMAQQQQQQQRQHTYEMPVAQPTPQRQPIFEMPVPQPTPQRQPSYEMPAEPVAPTDSSAGGFDLGAGYSRPQQQQHQQHQQQQQQGSPGGRREMPAQQDDGYGGSRPARGQQQGGGAYPGYRGYNAGQQGQQQQQQQQGW
jgi:hypothetical protein